jgi:hypothetical protein
VHEGVHQDIRAWADDRTLNSGQDGQGAVEAVRVLRVRPCLGC